MTKYKVTDSMYGGVCINYTGNPLYYYDGIHLENEEQVKHVIKELKKYLKRNKKR